MILRNNQKMLKPKFLNNNEKKIIRLIKIQRCMSFQKLLSSKKLHTATFGRLLQCRILNRKIRINLVRLKKTSKDYYRVGDLNPTHYTSLVLKQLNLPRFSSPILMLSRKKKLNKWMMRQILKDQLLKWNYIKCASFTINIHLINFILKIIVIYFTRQLIPAVNNKQVYFKAIKQFIPKTSKYLQRTNLQLKVPFNVTALVLRAQSFHRKLKLIRAAWLLLQNSFFKYKLNPFSVKKHKLSLAVLHYFTSRVLNKVKVKVWKVNGFHYARGVTAKRRRFLQLNLLLRRQSPLIKALTHIFKLLSQSEDFHKFLRPPARTQKRLTNKKDAKHNEYNSFKNLNLNINPFNKYSLDILRYNLFRRRLLNIKQGKARASNRKQKKLSKCFIKIFKRIFKSQNLNNESDKFLIKNVPFKTTVQELHNVLNNSTLYAKQRRRKFSQLILTSVKYALNFRFFKSKIKEKKMSFFFKRFNFTGLSIGVEAEKFNYLRQHNIQVGSKLSYLEQTRENSIGVLPGVLPGRLRTARSFFKKRARAFKRHQLLVKKYNLRNKLFWNYKRLKLRQRVILKYTRYKLKKYIQVTIKNKIKFRRALGFLLYCNTKQFVVTRYFAILKFFNRRFKIVTAKIKQVKKRKIKKAPLMKQKRRSVNRLTILKKFRKKLLKLPKASRKERVIFKKLLHLPKLPVRRSRRMPPLVYKKYRELKKLLRYQRTNFCWRVYKKRNFYKIRRSSPGCTFKQRYGADLGAFWRHKQLLFYRIRQVHRRKIVWRHTGVTLKLLNHRHRLKVTFRHLRHYKYRYRRSRRRRLVFRRRRRLFRKFYSLDRKILKIYQKRVDKLLYKRLPYKFKLPKISYYWPKQSNYQYLFKNQLRAQQRFRWLFRLRYDQIVKMYKKVIFYTKRRFEYKFLKYLEFRIDTIIYRLNFAFSLAQARLLVRKYYFTVNEKLVSWPKYQVNIGDIIIPRYMVRLRQHPEHLWTFDHGYFYNSTRLFWRPIQLSNYTNHFIINERVPAAIIIHNPNPFTVHHIKQFSLQHLTCSLLKYS